MSDYINFSDCRDDFYAAVLNILSADGTNDRANLIIDVFDSLPTVDVKTVVYCKDCEFSDRCSIVEYGGMGLNDYCSKGKRKELDYG